MAEFATNPLAIIVLIGLTMMVKMVKTKSQQKIITSEA
jgi:hypothetical protein